MEYQYWNPFIGDGLQTAPGIRQAGIGMAVASVASSSSAAAGNDRRLGSSKDHDPACGVAGRWPPLQQTHPKKIASSPSDP
jgi:hypothetical protein